MKQISVGSINRSGLILLAMTTLVWLVAAGEGRPEETCTSLTFTDPAWVATESSPLEVVVADLNGDDKPDLVIANSLSQSVSVGLGDGSGKFGAPTSFEASSYPHAIAVGDLNEDGNPDLAVANCSSGNISILLGDGLGGFGPPSNFEAGICPSDIVLGDFNGDDNLDAAVGESHAYGVNILLGDGEGNLGEAVNFHEGWGPTDLVAADFNHDGELDLALPASGSTELVVLGGDGTGAFTRMDSHPIAAPRGACAADFNLDGDIDLAVTSIEAGKQRVAIFLGNGDGTFEESESYPAMHPLSVVAVDLNGDGALDLATAGFYTLKATILMGDGVGGFGPAQYVKTFRPAEFIAAGDLNVDGMPDLVTTCSAYNRAGLLMNLPILRLRVRDAGASEQGSNEGWFAVDRRGCMNADLRVHYTWSGTATPGTDYHGLSGHVTIPAGKSTVGIRVLPFEDAIAEGSETVIVTLAPDPAYAVGGQNTASITISDND